MEISSGKGAFRKKEMGLSASPPIAAFSHHGISFFGLCFLPYLNARPCSRVFSRFQEGLFLVCAGLCFRFIVAPVILLLIIIIVVLIGPVAKVRFRGAQATLACVSVAVFVAWVAIDGAGTGRGEGGGRERGGGGWKEGWGDAGGVRRGGRGGGGGEGVVIC